APAEVEVQGCIARCRTAADNYSGFWGERAPGVYLLAHQGRPPDHILNSDTVFPRYERREGSAFIQKAELVRVAEEERKKEEAEARERALLEPAITPFIWPN